jgi:hypothetical protein
MTNNENTSGDTKKSPSLVGCEVVLDPTKGGMMADPANDFTFSYFRNKEGEITNDKRVITKDMELTLIKENIKHGILRVMKDGKDVTEKYGGPPKAGPVRPIVKKIVSKPDAGDNIDAALLRVLDTNDVNQVGVYIQQVNDFASLQRLLELEQQGSNPTEKPRRSIVDALSDKIKHVSGIKVGKDENAEEEEITVHT